MFLKALYGTDYSNKRIVDGDYDKAKIRRLHWLSATQCGYSGGTGDGRRLCAVLTGNTRRESRGYFEKLGAKYILKSVEDFLVEGRINGKTTHNTIYKG